MKPTDPPPTAPQGEAFTVVMPGVLRERFERWLRREHLQMTPLGGDPLTRVHVVTEVR